jgi:hypothetical protein
VLVNLPRWANVWLPGYCRDRFVRATQLEPIQRVWLAVADHFEPYWDRVDDYTARARVNSWLSHWPNIANRSARDSAGASPVYTFFYPEEEYRVDILNSLAELCRACIGDVEVHIHHDGEGREDFIKRISLFSEVLHHRHGLLRKQNGKIRFGFIHGNWALDNSIPGGRWCGLNDEISILRDLGCYADFTMPAGAHPSQASLINRIYWCEDDPNKPKSYDRGVDLRVGGKIHGDLLMIPGPFGWRWRERLVPRLETGELAHNNLPTPYRVKRWFSLSPRVGNDLFVKLYTHGSQERNSSVLLNGALEQLYSLVAGEASRRRCEYYWVSTWEMYCVVDAIRCGKDPVSRLAGIRADAGSSANTGHLARSVKQ